MDNKQQILEEIANTIVTHSLGVANGDKVLIRFKNQETFPLLKLIISKIFEQGGIPFVKFAHQELDDILMSNYDVKDLEEVLKRREFDVLNHDCFISLGYNISYDKIFNNNAFRYEYAQAKRELDTIYNSKRWVLVNYPSFLDAKKLDLSYEDCFDKLMKYIAVDYKKMEEAMVPLKLRMDNAQNVRIVAKDTDLTFSKQSITSRILAGTSNLPDGEIYSAPIKNSINGYIQFNIDSSFAGDVFKNIRLEFCDGRVVGATTENGKDEILNEILNQDEGARYVGEFAFGTNPNITNPITDTLYDEKMLGSIHLALGNCYPDADNGNSSCIHWDMIKYLKKEYGGGKVYFDDELVMDDGLFVPQSLKSLNKEDNSYEQNR